MANGIVEATAASLPVVTTTVDGMAQVVAGGITGFLVSPAIPIRRDGPARHYCTIATYGVEWARQSKRAWSSTSA